MAMMARVERDRTRGEARQVLDPPSLPVTDRHPPLHGIGFHALHSQAVVALADALPLR